MSDLEDLAEMEKALRPPMASICLNDAPMTIFGGMITYISGNETKSFWPLFEKQLWMLDPRIFPYWGA